MIDPQRGGAWSALGWMAFPLVPVLLATACHRTLKLGVGAGDPHDWGVVPGLLILGPLLGYGFLAGAMAALPDEPGHRGWKALVSHRAAWVGVGPWVGFLAWVGIYYAAVAADLSIVSLDSVVPPGWKPWVEPVLVWIVAITLPYGWLAVAVVAARRARRHGRLGRSIGCGLVTALGFVGSLIGGFWAATAAWRSYFFDPTILQPVVLALLAVAVAGGCSGPVTAGEVRRRELFDAMLAAWVLGLALAWRWWARPRPPRR